MTNIIRKNSTFSFKGPIHEDEIFYGFLHSGTRRWVYYGMSGAEISFPFNQIDRYPEKMKFGDIMKVHDNHDEYMYGRLT